MSEGMLLLVWISKILSVVICAILYRLGGWDKVGKWARRFVMPIVYFGACTGIAFWRGVWNPFMYISLPLMIASLCLGYNTNGQTNFKKRSLVGLAFGCSFLPFPFIFGNNLSMWIMFGFHILLAYLSMIIFGFFETFKKKDTDGASEAEAMIAMLGFILPIMMI